MCQEYIDISTVLRTERCMLTREVKKVLMLTKPYQTWLMLLELDSMMIYTTALLKSLLRLIGQKVLIDFL